MSSEVALNICECLNNKFENKNCHVLGFARSNKPLVELLISAGANVTVRDMNTKAADSEEAISFASRGVKFITGEGYLDGLDADYIFRTPAIRPDLPKISEAVARGAVLSSEMELFFEICPCPIFGITGSDGKTTTTTLTYLLLSKEKEKSGEGL